MSYTTSWQIDPQFCEYKYLFCDLGTLSFAGTIKKTTKQPGIMFYFLLEMT